MPMYSPHFFDAQPLKAIALMVFALSPFALTPQIPSSAMNTSVLSPATLGRAFPTGSDTKSLVVLGAAGGMATELSDARFLI